MGTARAAAIPTGDTVQSELVMVFESAMEVCNSVARSSTIHPEEVAALRMLPEFAGGFGVPSRLDFEVSEIADPLTTAIVKVGRCLNSGDGETRDTATLMANALCTEWKVVDVLALLSQPFTIPRDLNRSAKEYIRDALLELLCASAEIIPEPLRSVLKCVGSEAAAHNRRLLRPPPSPLINQPPQPTR